MGKQISSTDTTTNLLKPGGILAVMDFYVSEANPDRGFAKHSGMERWFWRNWFARDGVHPNAEHLSLLRQLLPNYDIVESQARVPYLPLLRVPYFQSIGRKPMERCGAASAYAVRDLGP
ncbi:hypothetical protein ELE36_10550 [Pseudolysobacter antarcticus]|uniref:Class I SAM-dependent methyltransferase n=1 Tax=Pseudolysobacter antarcticus TaxID=2511995 RepID=A0A411HJP2_9GAMM|nr:hypothetical protein [Pseudolysobacter antarcticus]QBB70759.1 hypothetical protein ELE36_10550 [Pseudolysobacter antarcticus]